MATTSRGIVYPTTGNAVTPLATRFADLATSADTAIGAVDTKFSNDNRQFYGPAASIGSVTGMKLGDTYQESNSNKILWKYDGANWVTNEGGMYLIRPSSVTGGLSIASDGSIVGTSLTGSHDTLGIFSSRFANYRIETYLTKSAVTENVQVNGLVGTTSITSASHYSQALFITGTNAPAGSYYGAQTSFGAVLESTGQRAASSSTWYSPNLAENTLVFSSNVGRNGQAQTSNRTCGLETADQLTGLRLSFGVSAGIRMKVYGLA